MKYPSSSLTCRDAEALSRQRVGIWIAFCLAATVFFELPTHAAAPTNDVCAGAEIIPSGVLATPGAVYFTEEIEDMSAASNDGDVVTPGCVNFSASSLWYRFTPLTNASYTFSVGTDSGTTVQDTVMAVYESSGGSCESGLTVVACIDDEASLQAALRVALTTGRTYFIVVWNGPVIPAVPPNAKVRMKVSLAAAPSNDTCAGALEIPASSLPYYTPPVDATLATAVGDPTLPACATIGGTRGVWYRFVPADSGGYIFSTRNTTNTTVLDTLIGVFRSASPCSGSYTRVACDDGGNGKASVGAQLTAGTSYYIVVWEGGNEPVTLSETSIELRVERARQPEVTTLAATNILSILATLVASVDPNGLPTGVSFQYGETPDFGFSTSWRSIGAGDAPVVTNRPLSGFAPNIIYYFRAVATNAGGTSFGDPNSFYYSTEEIRLTMPEREVSGPFSGEFNGAPGQVYQVRASTNLSNWDFIGLASHLGEGRHQFIDRAATNHPRRFYWIVSP